MAPSQDSKSKRHLLLLPQELLYTILDFAYPEDVVTDYITLEDWDARELERRRENPSGYTPRAFTAHKVNEFMVSKAFFLCASQAWARNQHFKDCTFRNSNGTRNGYHLNPWSTFASSRGHEKQSIAFRHCTKLSISISGDYFKAYRLPSLRVLIAKIDHQVFECVEPTFAWESPLSETQLCIVRDKVKLSKLSGLKKVTFIADENRYATSAAQKQQWTANVAALERLIMAMMPSKKEGKKPEAQARKAKEFGLHGLQASSLTVWREGLELTNVPTRVRPTPMKQQLDAILSLLTQPDIAIQPSSLALTSSSTQTVEKTSRKSASAPVPLISSDTQAQDNDQAAAAAAPIAARMSKITSIGTQQEQHRKESARDEPPNPAVNTNKQTGPYTYVCATTLPKRFAEDLVSKSLKRQKLHVRPNGQVKLGTQARQLSSSRSEPPVTAMDGPSASLSSTPKGGSSIQIDGQGTQKASPPTLVSIRLPHPHQDSVSSAVVAEKDIPACYVPARNIHWPQCNVQTGTSSEYEDSHTKLRAKLSALETLDDIDFRVVESHSNASIGTHIDVVASGQRIPAAIRTPAEVKDVAKSTSQPTVSEAQVKEQRLISVDNIFASASDDGTKQWDLAADLGENVTSLNPEQAETPKVATHVTNLAEMVAKLDAYLATRLARIEEDLTTLLIQRVDAPKAGAGEAAALSSSQAEPLSEAQYSSTGTQTMEESSGSTPASLNARASSTNQPKATRPYPLRVNAAPDHFSKFSPWAQYFWTAISVVVFALLGALLKHTEDTFTGGAQAG